MQRKDELITRKDIEHLATREDLTKLATMEEVSELRKDVSVLKGDVSVLKSDVSVLKGDVSVLKGDVSVLKSDVSVLKDDVSVLKDDVSVLKDDVSVLKDDVGVLKGDINRLAVQVVKNTEVISTLVTKDEFNGFKEEMRTGLDKVMVILERLDQERHFTFEAVRRLETDYQKLDKDVKHHRKEIDHIKEVLHV